MSKKTVAQRLDEARVRKNRKIDCFRAENERLRKALEAIAMCAVCDGWCGSCAMGHELAFYNTGEEGVAQFAREALEATDDD